VFYGGDGNIYMAAEHVGVRPDEILDFSSNVYPAPLPAAVREEIARRAEDIGRYPDPEAREVRCRAAERFGVGPEGVLAGCGATEFIYAVPRALRARRVVVVAPCYHDYWRAVEQAGGDAEGMLAVEGDEFVPDLAQLEAMLSGVDLVILGNPNNPTGVSVPADALRLLAARFPGTFFLADETYTEFVPEAGGATLLGQPLPRNVIVVRSLSSFFAVPGLRLGFMIADADLCNQVRRVREPWRVGVLAQAAGCALLAADIDSSALRERVIAERERLRDELARMAGLRVFHSQANFLLVKITRPTFAAGELCERLLRQNILIRNAAGFRGLDGRFVRISVRLPEENDRFLEAMRRALDDKLWE